jgi:hypothetical protein
MWLAIVIIPIKTVLEPSYKILWTLSRYVLVFSTSLTFLHVFSKCNKLRVFAPPAEMMYNSNTCASGEVAVHVMRAVIDFRPRQDCLESSPLPCTHLWGAHVPKIKEGILTEVSPSTAMRSHGKKKRCVSFGDSKLKGYTEVVKLLNWHLGSF